MKLPGPGITPEKKFIAAIHNLPVPFLPFWGQKGCFKIHGHRLPVHKGKKKTGVSTVKVDLLSAWEFSLTLFIY